MIAFELTARIAPTKGSIMNRLAISLLATATSVLPLILLPLTPVTAQSKVVPKVLAKAQPKLAAARSTSINRPSSDIVLSIGRGQLINIGGVMTDVFIADSKVADVQIKSSHQLYLFGKAGGETTAYASNSAGEIIWSTNIRVGSNIDSVDQMLRMAMPDAKIMVSTMGTGAFLLTGTVAAPEDAAEAQRLVQAFVGKDSNIITRLKTATPMQVTLQVKFSEVSRSLVREIGSNLETQDAANGFMAGISRGRDAGTFPTSPASGTSAVSGNFKASPSGATTLGLAGHLLGLDVLAALDLGEKLGLVTTLSAPNLTALSGETAEFLAGGQYPIPVSQGLGQASIEYKNYGVSLSYTPTVLSNGRISLRVRPEVSEISSQGAVTIAGFQVPALTTRRAETSVELGSGQSMMIAGLMSNSSQQTMEKMPGAGDLPIVGALFRSSKFQRGETELVIVITPYLVNPIDANDIKLPTDGFKNPNELQRLFGNMDNAGKSGETRPHPMADLQGNGSPPPGLGELDRPGTAMAEPNPANQANRKSKRRKGNNGNEGSGPGFSLN